MPACDASNKQFSLTRYFPGHLPTFGKFPDICQAAVKVSDISRFSGLTDKCLRTNVPTLTDILSLRDGIDTVLTK